MAGDAPPSALASLASRRASLTAGEALFLPALAAAPWPYGGSSDPRVTRSAPLCSWPPRLGARAGARRARPAGARAARGRPAAARRAAARCWAAARRRSGRLEAVCCSRRCWAPTCFWSERARRARRRAARARAGGARRAARAGGVRRRAVVAQPDRVYGRASPIVTDALRLLREPQPLRRPRGDGRRWSRPGPGARPRRARDAARRRARSALGGLALALVASHLASRSRGGLLALAGGLAGAGCAALAASARGSAAGAYRGGRGRRGGGRAARLRPGRGARVRPAATSPRCSRGPSDLSGEYRLDVAAARCAWRAQRPLTGLGPGRLCGRVPRVQARPRRGADHARGERRAGVPGRGRPRWAGLLLAVLGCRGRTRAPRRG